MIKIGTPPADAPVKEIEVVAKSMSTIRPSLRYQSVRSSRSISKPWIINMDSN